MRIPRDLGTGEVALVDPGREEPVPPSPSTRADGADTRVGGDEESAHGRRSAALGLGAVGVLALGVGTYLGLHARSLWDQSNQACPMEQCTPAGVELGLRADSYATASTWTFVGGGVTLGAAAIFLLWPASSSVRDSKVAQVLGTLRVDARGGLGLGGAF